MWGENFQRKRKTSSLKQVIKFSYNRTAVINTKTILASSNTVTILSAIIIIPAMISTSVHTKVCVYNIAGLQCFCPYIPMVTYALCLWELYKSLLHIAPFKKKLFMNIKKKIVRDLGCFLINMAATLSSFSQQISSKHTLTLVLSRWD